MLEELAATALLDMPEALVVRLGVDTLELANELLVEDDDAWPAYEPSGFLLVLGWRRLDDLRLPADDESMSYHSNTYSAS